MTDKNKSPNQDAKAKKQLTKDEKKPKYTLEELLALVTDENIHPEIPTGKPVGKEIW